MLNRKDEGSKTAVNNAILKYQNKDVFIQKNVCPNKGYHQQRRTPNV